MSSWVVKCQHKFFTIRMADKRHAKVVMDKDLYNHKVLSMLDDHLTYKILDEDPSVAITDSISYANDNLLAHYIKSLSTIITRIVLVKTMFESVALTNYTDRKGNSEPTFR